MEKCKHGLDIEKPCSLCVGDAMKTMPAVDRHKHMVDLANGIAAPANEHEHVDTLSEDVYYPDHPPRTESRTFKATKAAGHKAKLPCAISGHTDGVEYHHVFCGGHFRTLLTGARYAALLWARSPSYLCWTSRQINPSPASFSRPSTRCCGLSASWRRSRASTGARSTRASLKPSSTRCPTCWSCTASSTATETTVSTR